MKRLKYLTIPSLGEQELIRFWNKVQKLDAAVGFGLEPKTSVAMDT